MTIARSRFDIEISGPVIRRAVAGDESAFEAIYHVFRQPIFGLARRICRNETAASDVVQDVFLQVFRQIHRFRGNGPFWAWLRMIAVRKALDHTADNARLIDTAAFDDCASAASGVEDQVAVLQVLAELPERTRLILWLNRIEGFTHEELAEMTGMTASHSKSLVSRSLQYLARRHADHANGRRRGAA